MSNAHKNEYGQVEKRVVEHVKALGARIREARTVKGMSQKDFAAWSGIGLTSLQAYEAGRTSPGMDYFFRLQELGVDADYVMTGLRLPSDVRQASIAGVIGPEMLSKLGGSIASSLLEPGRPANDDLVMIEEIDLAYGLGASFADGPVGVRKHEISRTFLRSITQSAPANLTLARGVGDSMDPVISDGDVVMIDRSQQFQQDAIMALSVGELAMIKRVRRDGSRVQLLSDNQRIPPYEVSADEVNLVGRVVFVGKHI